MTDSPKPAGWYHAQGDPSGTYRYWDGSAWYGGPRRFGDTVVAEEGGEENGQVELDLTDGESISVDITGTESDAGDPPPTAPTEQTSNRDADTADVEEVGTDIPAEHPNAEHPDRDDDIAEGLNDEPATDDNNHVDAGEVGDTGEVGLDNVDGDSEPPATEGDLGVFDVVRDGRGTEDAAAVASGSRPIEPPPVFAQNPAASPRSAIAVPRRRSVSRGFWGSLFDLSFTSFITRRAISGIYIAVLVVIGLVTAVSIAAALTRGFAGVLALLVIIPVALLQLVFVRLALEFLVNQFRQTELMEEMADRMRQD